MSLISEYLIYLHMSSIANKTVVTILWVFTRLSMGQMPRNKLAKLDLYF